MLPDSVARREKKPFCNGRTAELAHRLVVDALSRNGMALVEEALAGSGLPSTSTETHCAARWPR